MFIKLSIIANVLIGLLFNPFVAKNYIHITKRFEIHGIDISHHQRTINWENVQEHSDFKISFCFLKATEGATFKDTKFPNYWKDCKEAGISRGAYHFFSISKSPYAQAQNFIGSVDLQKGDLAPVLDFESDSQNLSTTEVRKRITTWLTIVEKHYGVKPIIYTNSHLFNKYIKGYFKSNPLWIANYNTSDINYAISHPNLKFWQYTEKGKVDGITGSVDINAFLGEYQEFENLKIY